jgi:predicted RNase H-like nuclease (RuvC/YqgF family)
MAPKSALVTRKEIALAKPRVVAERREPDVVEEALAMLDAAASAIRAEISHLAEKRVRLTAEIDELKAKRAELEAECAVEQRKLTELHGLTGLEFLKRCTTAGIDKHTVEELRAQLRSEPAEIEETLSRTNKKESSGGDTKL